MEEEHTKEPSHNNPEEAANYVKAVDNILKKVCKQHPWIQPLCTSRRVQELSTHFIPAPFKIRQRIFHQHGHPTCA